MAAKLSSLYPPAVARALIHLCRKVFPQPKLRDRSFPVPRGMTATDGGGSSFSSRMVPSSQATVPSPPAAKMRRRLQPVGASYADAWFVAGAHNAPCCCLLPALKPMLAGLSASLPDPQVCASVLHHKSDILG